MIEVACCLIRDSEGKILLAQKASAEWEFPGGKRHADETLFQCAERENLEELGIHIKAESVEEFSAVVGDGRFELKLVICSFVSGEVVLTEHKDAKWFQPKEIAALVLCAGDRQLWGACGG